MTTELRAALHRTADSVRPVALDDDLWQRGRAARRRGQVLAVAGVLAVLASVGGVVTLVSTDHEVRTASTQRVPGGAIPSRIVDTDTGGPGETDLAIGRASVAFISQVTNLPVVIGAEDGRYHHLDMSPPLALALSPDGARLAVAMPEEIEVVDLGTGDLMPFDHHGGADARIASLSWLPDSTHLVWTGHDDDREFVAGVVDVTAPSEVPAHRPEALGLRSPTGDLYAMPSSGGSVEFLREGPGPGGGPFGEVVQRTLDKDIYPSGAAVTPLGWATDDLVLAQVYSGPGSYVEGQHLALFTAPNRPRSQWTYRIVARDIPQNAVPLSIAVDLVPDLDGTSSQVLTHDFGAPGGQRDISWIIGLGVAAAIGVLLGLRWLWRRLLG